MTVEGVFKMKVAGTSPAMTGEGGGGKRLYLISKEKYLARIRS